MKVFNRIEDIGKLRNPVATVGMYDGVHIAHKLILQRVRRLAKEINGESVLITFEPHPRSILHPNEKIELLTTKEEKIFLLETIGIDAVVFIPFTLEFSKLSSVKFVKSIIVDAINAKKIVVGYNHYYGHNREGNFELLYKLGAQFGFEVEEIPEQDIQNESISSSKIRQALAQGDVMKANTYLDYKYSFNITLMPSSPIFLNSNHKEWIVALLSDNKLMPAEGLYFVDISVDQKSHKGALWLKCNSEISKEIRLFTSSEFTLEKPIQNTEISLNHMVKACTREINYESIQKTIENLLFKANL